MTKDAGGGAASLEATTATLLRSGTLQLLVGTLDTHARSAETVGAALGALQVVIASAELSGAWARAGGAAPLARALTAHHTDPTVVRRACRVIQRACRVPVNQDAFAAAGIVPLLSEALEAHAGDPHTLFALCTALQALALRHPANRHRFVTGAGAGVLPGVVGALAAFPDSSSMAQARGLHTQSRPATHSPPSPAAAQAGGLRCDPERDRVLP